MVMLGLGLGLRVGTMVLNDCQHSLSICFEAIAKQRET